MTLVQIALSRARKAPKSPGVPPPVTSPLPAMCLLISGVASARSRAVIGRTHSTSEREEALVEAGHEVPHIAATRVLVETGEAGPAER
jgi:hypothetical protein